MDHPEDQYPNPNNTTYHFDCESFDPLTMEGFELSDYLMLDDIGAGDDHLSSSPSMVSVSEQGGSFSSAGDNDATSREIITTTNKGKNGAMKKKKMEEGYRVAFKTKSEVEVMDDGFKWRKYGKKSVKNSPNPRNYYKCTRDGCNVKKRVERDREDINFVITTYEGVHNHESTCVAYYNQMPTAAP